jgi:hypothetical protein
MFQFRLTKVQCYLMQGIDEQSGKWTKPRPQLKQPLTTPANPKKTKKVRREVQKSRPFTSREWGDEWN